VQESHRRSLVGYDSLPNLGRGPGRGRGTRRLGLTDQPMRRPGLHEAVEPVEIKKMLCWLVVLLLLLHQLAASCRIDVVQLSVVQLLLRVPPW